MRPIQLSSLITECLRLRQSHTVSETINLIGAAHNLSCHECEQIISLLEDTQQ